MAKRYDNDFDADAFVENFRAKEAPTSPPRNNTEESISTVQEPHSSVLSNHKGTSASKSRNSALSAQVEEYRRRFIDDLTYLCPPSYNLHQQPAQTALRRMQGRNRQAL